MTNPRDDLHALRLAAQSYANSLAEAGTADVVEHLGTVPVPARLLVAAVVLAAADKPVSTVNVYEVAAVSRGSAYNHHKAEMALIRGCVPAMVRAQMALLGSTAQTAELDEQVRERDESIRKLGEDNRRLREEHDAAVGYARDLRERLRPELEAIANEQAEKVHTFRPVPRNRDTT